MVVVYVWNRQVSPHDLLQEVVTASKKKFMIGKPAECIEFFSWLLNTLHAVSRLRHNPQPQAYHQRGPSRLRLISS